MVSGQTHGQLLQVRTSALAAVRAVLAKPTDPSPSKSVSWRILSNTLSGTCPIGITRIKVRVKHLPERRPNGGQTGARVFISRGKRTLARMCTQEPMRTPTHHACVPCT